MSSNNIVVTVIVYLDSLHVAIARWETVVCMRGGARGARRALINSVRFRGSRRLTGT